MEETARNFSVNLRELTAYYPSVAEICRRIGINRQQFNKYLSGAVMPSLHNLRRISDFFGVEEAELLLPHSAFKETVFSRQIQEKIPTELAMALRQQRSAIKKASSELSRYLGWYHSYLRSPTFKSKIVRDVTVLFASGDFVFSKSVNQARTRANRTLVEKNDGIVFWKDNQIYLLETETTSKGGFATCILYPSSHASLSSLKGLITGLGHEPSRRVFSSKLIMDYLGPKTDIRKAIAATGVFSFDDETIDEEIREELQDGLLIY